MQDGFFSKDGDFYIPRELGKGYWKDATLHGRAIIGLLGYEIERLHGGEGWVPARLTVDMFRMPELEPVKLETRVLSAGKRLRLIEADFIVRGTLAARATCQLLFPSLVPDGTIWTPDPWDVPHPETLDNGRRTPMFEIREISGPMIGAQRKLVWTRELHSLVLGEKPSAYARAALGADFVSPMVHLGDVGVRYINTDITLQLHRLPVGEWIGFEATLHDATAGIAIGHARVYDLDGPCGFVAASALTNQRR